MQAKTPGHLFVVSAPSGVGKTTLLRRVLQDVPGLRYSVSCTTRSPRPGEEDATDYFFLSREEFEDGIRSGRFLEWARVHGNYYGTDGRVVEEWLHAGWDVLLEIDVQGARQVRVHHPSATTIFILPPSMEVLRQRLQARGTESPEQLEMRLEAARSELREAPWYDYLVVNDALDEAVQDLAAIFRACRCRRRRSAPALRSLLETP
ncbi:guanylate kinase [Desulfacinum hydrothermale DSM 13146]|uniref:Guanylate kinase n=1 Tax=Desulfacinum hydrothermale DSM 13146 TaxID=1121390 RepID=A0A1W1XSQ8_9BACT|nr:guanylate kinase [Desulfacinum hydrothermale]SMC26894.1 guanylate kinase [Desulfacinum hydrothermale DSM 13146]